MNSQELSIPLLGLGTLRLCGDACVSIVSRAIELGYRHIDTAPVYHNHADIRKGISPFDRDNLFITSKYLPEQGCLETACNLALKELGLDYLDLYLIHWPDRTQPMEDILRSMGKLKEKGMIREYGVSNYTIYHLKDMLDKGIRIPCNQVEFHPYLYQKELWDYCKKNHIQLISYRPLGRGELLSDPSFEKIAQKYQKTSAQVVLRWVLEKKIPVLVKTSSENHLKENLGIFDFSLTHDEMQMLDGLNHSKRFCMTKWADFNYQGTGDP